MATASAASLAINVTTRGISGAQRELRSLSTSAANSSRASNNLNSSVGSLSSSVVKMGASVAQASAAVAAAAVGMAAFTIAVAGTVKEQERLAKTLGLTLEDFDRLGFVLASVGINTEKLGDQFKDINDRLGEFTSVGTGAFQDLADVLGLNTSQAQAFAQELAQLSGEDQVRAIAAAMDAANISTKQMTFAAESLADELSVVIPLFRDGAKSASELEKQYLAATDGLALTAGQTADLKELSQTFNTLGIVVSKSGEQIAATLAQYVIPIIEASARIIRDATLAIQGFFAQFQSPDSIKSIEVLNSKIAEENERLQILRDRYDALSDKSTLRAAQLKAEIQLTEGVVKASKQQIEAIDELNKQQEGAARSSVAGAGGTVIDINTLSDSDETEKLEGQFESLRNSLISEEQLIRESAAKRLEILAEAREQNLVADEEYIDLTLAANEEMTDGLAALQEKATAQAAAAALQQQQATLQGAAGIAGALSSLVQTFGGESKEAFRIAQALQIAQATINAYSAYTLALATIPPPAGNIVAASNLAIGLAQVATIASQQPPRRQGGDVTAGQTYLVGEAGAELFTPSRSGSIIPNERLNSGSSGQGITIINQTSGRIDEAEQQQDQDGRIIVLIRETVKTDLSNSNSDISKSLNRSTNTRRDRI